MKLYDKRFVHFEWTDELIDKKCFLGDNITDLLGKVETSNPIHLFEVRKTLRTTRRCACTAPPWIRTAGNTPTTFTLTTS